MTPKSPSETRCRNCDEPFFKTSPNQKYCTRNNFACLKVARKGIDKIWRRFKTTDAQLGGGRGATRALLKAQAHRCAACKTPFESTTHKTHPHSRFRVLRTPRALICPPCSSIVLSLKRENLDPIPTLAVAYLLAKPLLRGPALILSPAVTPAVSQPARDLTRPPRRVPRPRDGTSVAPKSPGNPVTFERNPVAEPDTAPLTEPPEPSANSS